MTGVKKQARLRRDPVPRTKVWLEVDGHYVFGAGSATFSRPWPKPVRSRRPQRASVRATGTSGPEIKETEQAIGAVLVTTQVGGQDVRRSELTQLGADLIRDFDALRQQVISLVEREFRRRLSATLDRHRRKDEEE